MKYIRVVFVDINGSVKGKLIPEEEYSPDKRYGMPRSVLVQDIEGEESHTLPEFTPESGDTDMVMVPDSTTFCDAPGNDGMSQVIADLVDENGQPFEESPREVLKRAVARLESAGFAVKVATELEFYVLKADGTIYDNRELEQPYGDINALDKLGGLLGNLVDGTASIGLKPEAVLSEAGPGQMEINFRPDHALAMADRTMLFKQMVREVTRSHNFQATFLAKPFAEHSGSGCHIHLSLWRDGQNIFAADPGLMEAFVAGITAYSHACYALWAPNPNSYRRIQLSHGYVPEGPSRGEDDRRVAFRLVGEGDGRRIENRIAGSDVNPYLMIASMLNAGLRGIEEGLNYGSDQVKESEAQGFVDNLPQALVLLEASSFARETLGERFVRAFCAVKHAEWAKFQAQITTWERDTYGTQV